MRWRFGGFDGNREGFYEGDQIKLELLDVDITFSGKRY